MMVQLVESIYWFDEALQRRLAERGWSKITRAQSIILANVANGEVRPARLAEKLGISKQGMSQALNDMVERDMVVLHRDPDDKRALIIEFSEGLEPMRNDAIDILEELEAILADIWGSTKIETVRSALAIDWRKLPDRRSTPTE